MPLLQSPAAVAASEIIGHAKHIAGHLAAAAHHLNAVTGHLLSLDDSNLASFCNGLGAVEMGDVLTRHFTTGAALNSAIETTNATLAAEGLPTVPDSVDVSPLSDKLAAQGRALAFEGGAFSVRRLEPPPADTPADPA